MREKYQSEASVIKPAIEEVLKKNQHYGEFVSIKRLTDEIVNAVLKAQRKHNHEVIGEE